MTAEPMKRGLSKSLPCDVITLPPVEATNGVIDVAAP
jgi:hypothetical protein